MAAVYGTLFFGFVFLFWRCIITSRVAFKIFVFCFLFSLMHHAAFGEVGGGGKKIRNFTEIDVMSFGSVVVDPLGDQLTLSAAGSISAQNGSIFFGDVSAALFSVLGHANTAVIISFSTGDTLTGAGAAMPIGNFTHNAGVTPAFDANGSISFSVGADLTINPSQGSGAYSGSYTVFIEYL